MIHRKPASSLWFFNLARPNEYRSSELGGFCTFLVTCPRCTIARRDIVAG